MGSYQNYSRRGTSIATMFTPEETRLKVRDLLMEILVSLAVDDETTDDEIATFEDDMGGVADLMLDSLGFQVVSVDNEEGTKFTAKLEIIDGDPLEEADLLLERWLFSSPVFSQYFCDRAFNVFLGEFESFVVKIGYRGRIHHFVPHMFVKNVVFCHQHFVYILAFGE